MTLSCSSQTRPDSLLVQNRGWQGRAAYLTELYEIRSVHWMIAGCSCVGIWGEIMGRGAGAVSVPRWPGHPSQMLPPRLVASMVNQSRGSVGRMPQRWASGVDWLSRVAVTCCCVRFGVGWRLERAAHWHAGDHRISRASPGLVFRNRHGKSQQRSSTRPW